jgi:hypothetical protein
MDRGCPPLLCTCQILSSYSRRDLGSTVWESRLLPLPGNYEWHDTEIAPTQEREGVRFGYGWHRQMETTNAQIPAAEPEGLAYSIQEATDLLGVDYLGVYGRHHLRGRKQPTADAVQSQACDRRDPYRRKRLTSAIFSQQGVELEQPA